jgi:hypothetical protein
VPRLEVLLRCMNFAQRRKGMKKIFLSSLLCGFAALREIFWV